MFALLILPILISGFIALSLSPKNRVLLHRYDGQLLYLKAAKIGLRYFMIAGALCLFFKEPRTIDIISFTTFDFPLVTLVAQHINKATNATEMLPESLKIAWLITVSFLTILLSYSIQISKIVLLKIQNFIGNNVGEQKFALFQNNDIARIAILGKFLSDSPIDYMFYESFKKRRPILVTLKSRKVYVGMVNKLGEPNESKEPNQEISLVTAISGYRDSDTLEVTFTNNYEVLDEQGAPIATPESIHILRLEQIDSVCWYHGATFSKVNGNMTTEKSDSPDTIEDCETCKSTIKAKFGPLYLLRNQK
ncbi:hypothetical protein BCT42_22470 [Vibrio lentus]|uniref:hypothetical protein n=1 Tax=Vibrio lentus TaxID=136468 RepID=UPI000C851E67|nr:hypothetical protein [Vibrio lentus]PMN00476.1 hypothetical protein BCT42_22470 [Vibrio lentus]